MKSWYLLLSFIIYGKGFNYQHTIKMIWSVTSSNKNTTSYEQQVMTYDT